MERTKSDLRKRPYIRLVHAARVGRSSSDRFDGSVPLKSVNSGALHNHLISTKAPTARQRLRRGAYFRGNSGRPRTRWTCMAGTYCDTATHTSLCSVRLHRSWGGLRFPSALDDASLRRAASKTPLQQALLRLDQLAQPPARIAKEPRQRSRQQLRCAARLTGSA